MLCVCRKPTTRRTKPVRCWSWETWRCSSRRAPRVGTIDRSLCGIRWEHNSWEQSFTQELPLCFHPHITSSWMERDRVLKKAKFCHVMTPSVTCPQVTEVWHAQVTWWHLNRLHSSKKTTRSVSRSSRLSLDHLLTCAVLLWSPHVSLLWEKVSHKGKTVECLIKSRNFTFTERYFHFHLVY